MNALTPTEKTILGMSARKDISFSDAELKFIDENISTVNDLYGRGWIDVKYDDRKHVRYIIILDAGRDVWYNTEKADGSGETQRPELI